MRNTKLIGFALASVAALSLPLIASADHHGGKHGGKKGGKFMERLAMFDADGDGNITQDEIAAHKAARFAAIDANGDGEVSLEEMSAHHEAMQAQKQSERQAKRFAAMDADGNGTLSAEELNTTGPGKAFERLDADSDGVLTADEIAAAKEKMKDRKGKWKGRQAE